MAPPVSPMTFKAPPSGPKALRPNGLPSRPSTSTTIQHTSTSILKAAKPTKPASSDDDRSVKLNLNGLPEASGSSSKGKVSIAFPSLPAKPAAPVASSSKPPASLPPKPVNLDSKSTALDSLHRDRHDERSRYPSTNGESSRGEYSRSSQYRSDHERRDDYRSDKYDRDRRESRDSRHRHSRDYYSASLSPSPPPSRRHKEDDRQRRSGDKYDKYDKRDKHHRLSREEEKYRSRDEDHRRHRRGRSYSVDSASSRSPSPSYSSHRRRHHRHSSESRSPSPVKPKANGKAESDFAFKSEPPRAPISFSIPSKPLSNGLVRARPPHLASPGPSSRPPSPPSEPPTPSVPPPPPPPPGDDPDPPISRPDSPSEPPPSDLPDAPGPPAEQPPPPPPPVDDQPPAFHFRELPTRPRLSIFEDNDTKSSASSSSDAHEIKEDSAPPPRPRSPTPLPPWEPHASTSCRPGLGNYVVTHDPALNGPKGGKTVVKRFDGGENGIEVSDPRLAMSRDARTRGRGASKHRPTVYELEYEWDEHSAGPKPPPPPSAVLITDLNPLTTVDQISKHFRPYGRVREIDSKMDLKSGMQLGICWVKFEGPHSGKAGSAHDVAVSVVKACDGQRIGLSGNEKIHVVLDGRGLRAERAVKEEMARRYPPKKPQPPAPTSSAIIATPQGTVPTPRQAATPPSGRATPRAVENIKQPPSGPSKLSPNMPRAFHSSLPARPRAYDTGISPFNRPVPRGPAAMPRPGGLPPRPQPQLHNIASSFIDAPFAPDKRGRVHDSYHDRYDRRDRSRSRSSSRSRSRYRRGRSHSCSTCSSYSDSEDDRPIYRRGRSPIRDRYRGQRGAVGARAGSAERKENEAAVEKVTKALQSNGLAYIYIETASLPAKTVTEEHLRDHFRAFKPAQVLCTAQAWYILFNDNFTAQRAKILDSTIVQGHRLSLQVKSASQPRPGQESTLAQAIKPNETAAAGAWKFLTITKKNRPAPPKAPTGPKADLLKSRKPSISSSESEDEAPTRRNRRRPSVSSMSELSEDELPVVPASRSSRILTSPRSDAEVSLAIPVASDTATPSVDGSKQVEDEEPVQKGKKRSAKATKLPKGKKARLTSPVVALDKLETPPVAEIQLDQIDSTVPAPAAKKISKPKKPAKTAVDKLFESGVVVDEEDAFWLGQALGAAHAGLKPDLSDDEEGILIDEKGRPMTDKHPLYHTSGCWRAEGWKKIPQIAKSAYLPERNRAQVSVEDATSLTSGRSARVTGRRLALDMETTRKTTMGASNVTAESDLFAFNQLRIRKKQLRFARSAIEGYGLYAMETIQPGEMVCEYVGEICRSAVAEIREQKYLKQGIGSSYLFRIDSDSICDATFRGSVSRLINHSCDPSASAKIISINGHSKIVIYAKRALQPGDEILYDYKFPLESDPALRVPCLCGAAACRGWLN